MTIEPIRELAAEYFENARICAELNDLVSSLAMEGSRAEFWKAVAERRKAMSGWERATNALSNETDEIDRLCALVREKEGS